MAEVIRHRAKMIKPAPGMEPAPVPPTPPQRSREDLLKLLRAKRQSLRHSGFVAKPVKSKKKAKETIDRMANEELTNEEAMKRMELEKIMEECDGDLNMFCQRSGINASFLPAIKNAVKAIGEGKSSKEAISTAATEVLGIAQKLQSR